MVRLHSCCCGCSVRAGAICTLLMNAVLPMCSRVTLPLMITPLLGLIGVFEYYPRFLLPYLVQKVLFMLFMVLLMVLVATYEMTSIVILTITGPYKRSPEEMVSEFIRFFEVVSTFSLLLQIYLDFIVFSFYRELKEDDDAQS